MLPLLILIFYFFLLRTDRKTERRTGGKNREKNRGKNKEIFFWFSIVIKNVKREVKKIFSWENGKYEKVLI